MCWTIIHQEGSSIRNKGRQENEKLNLVNFERLNEDKEGSVNHPWEKMNLCLKGKANVEKFNKCIARGGFAGDASQVMHWR